MMVNGEGRGRVRRAAIASVNVAEAKKRLSDLLGRVAYAGETVLITRRGRPMARLVPLEPPDAGEGLAGVRGWLGDEDPFFDRIDTIVAARGRRRPRAYRAGRKGSR
jgi:prevent-host-death family protein